MGIETQIPEKMNSTTDSGLWESLIGLRALFYIVPPSEAVKDVEDVPDYTKLAIPWFYGLIAIDIFMGYLRSNLSFEPRDSMASITAGVMSRITALLGERSLEMGAYIWAYNKWHLLDLDYQSPVIWLATALGYDLGYYITHRIGHEWNCMWAAHQTHHSSEYYNLSTALRQSMWHKYFTFPTYLPLAIIGIPPSQMLLHREMNLLYQFWVHTTQIPKLWWPIEYIFNTPSHHRVHHGRNEYCLDKNYAAVLIIWDRMFGTFEAEREEEPVVYGLVTPIKTYDPIKIQSKYYLNIFNFLVDSKYTIRQKFEYMFYSPGWNVGEQVSYPIPKITIENNQPWHVRNNGFLNLYILLQFATQATLFVLIMGKVHLFGFIYSLMSYWSFGNLAKNCNLFKISFEFVRLALGIYHFGQNEEILSRRICEILLQMNIFSVFYLTAFTACFIFSSTKTLEKPGKSTKRE